MSFSFRDKPRLSDRIRGKSGDEILNEFREHFDQDRKMFFDTNPSWGSTPMTGPFSRAGFPFEDDMMSRGRQDIRSHLDDLAQRHPEFADHLRCPPWGGEMGDARTWGRKRRGSGSGDDDARSQASGASSSSNEPAQPDGAENQENQEEPGPLRGRPRPGNLPHYGLRNTVDLGQQQHESEQEKQGRGQRSMSAPPDNRTQQPQQPRYVSRVEINPVNPADPTSGGGPVTVTSESHAKPPVAPKQPQQQQSTPTKQAGNVRHIPIFVEGRDEPILPKNVGTEKVEQVFPSREQVFTSQHSPHSFGRPPPFGSHHFYQQPQQPSPAPQAPRGFQQPQSPKVQRQAKPQPPQQPQPQQQQQPPPPPQQQQQQQQQPQPQQQPHHHSPPANDPISRVLAVQKDVEELKAKVEQYSGNSRKDKEYIYLDEMLTRNLLKLDDIDTEGKDNVRQARKDVIRSIQKCISVLEEKVPIPNENKEPSTEEVPMETGAEESQTTETAESEKIEATAPSTENEMEVVKSESATKDAVEERNVNEQVVADATPVVEGQTNENVQSDAVKSEELKMDVTQSNESKEAVPEESGEVKEQIPMEVEEQKAIPETTQSENPQPENSQKEISQPDTSQTEATQPEKSKTESTQQVAKPIKKKGVKKGAKKDSASAEKSDKSASGDSNKVPEPTSVSESKDSSTTPAETSTPQPEAKKSS